MTDNSGVCPICGGLGLVTTDVPFGHPDFGKAFPCICQAENVKQRRASQLRKLGNLEAYADKTFASFQVDYALMGEDEIDMRVFKPIAPSSSLTEEQRLQINFAARQTLAYAQNPQGWLLLKGSYGAGKTHLAAAIANWRLDHGEPVLFIGVPDLLDHLRATYGPSSEVAYDARFEQVRAAPLLILDDLGAESQTPWALEKLYQLFSHRHASKLPTVITTNNDPETFDPRIRSRLLDQDLTQSLPLEVPDHRLPITTWQEMDLSNLGRYQDMTFQTFDLRQSEGLAADHLTRLERTFQMAQQYAEASRGWLVLTGEPGCGKTHLAAGIAHECKQRGQKTLFVTASELLDYLRVTFHPGSSARYSTRLAEIKGADVLILDDLTIDQSLSSWARDKLFEVLIYRFDTRLPTVITTVQPLQNMDARLRSRFVNEARSRVEALTVPAYPGKVTVRRAAPPRRSR